eukprot:CAMPEP_0174935410 /NCGR_PEP_ID=MMETSP1355-20121228/53687_1 /TAXON_ID=464990 /ORGANISM="Hemiselmis tepida, Strain CCMP443" /LENGTH=265 /DNA_ID=CAMNT_0016182099 /DNA_START=72 /DNA_END=866 /DNA_ORIENTATION=-
MTLRDASSQSYAMLEDMEGENPHHEGFNFRHALSELAAYSAENPDFAAGVGIWMMVGFTLLIAGLILFLFSEIKAVLVCRDQDFRKSLVDAGYMSPSAAGIADLEMRESRSMIPRPYLSVGGMMIIYLGLSCVLYPICDILDIIDLPAVPCILLITVGSFFASFCIITFWLAVVWSCTRPWAALAFLIISLSGNLLLPTGSPILVVIWMIVAFGGGYFYFKYIPEQYALNGDERPAWVQDVGDYTISLDPGEWGDAASVSYQNTV